MNRGKRILFVGSLLLACFIVWTILIQIIDVQPIGQNGTDIGFATFNHWFHELTGVHMELYIITDWLGLVPIAVCIGFAGMGLVQWMQRKSLLRVDYDILFLGIYYAVVLFVYLLFETIPINYRPILIEGIMEVSYPSSTTLLVLCVMTTLVEQIKRRFKQDMTKQVISMSVFCFSLFMLLGRLVSGVHWFTDIIGSIMLGTGLFCIYKSLVLLWGDRHGIS